jgi:hypothetical protein
MFGFGKKSPFLRGKLNDIFESLNRSKKQQFYHAADEMFSHFHKYGDVMGMEYLLNCIIVKKRDVGVIEFIQGYLENLLIRDNYSVMFRVKDLQTIKEFVERDGAFSVGGPGSGTRYRSGLSHAANEAALWHLVGRNDINAE